MDPVRTQVSATSFRILINSFVFLVTPSLYYGMAIPIYVRAAMIVTYRGYRSMASRAITAAGIIGFLLMTINVVGGIHVTALNLQSSYLLASCGQEGLDIVKNAQNIALPILDTANGLSLYLSDAVVIWRASKLLGSRPKTIGFLLIAWTAGIGCLLGQIVVDSTRRNDSAQVNKIPMSKHLIWANCFLSLLVNALATGLIYHGLWNQNRSFGKAGELMPESRALLILIETGGAFCIYQAIDRLLDFLIYFSVIPERLTALMIYNAIDQGTYSFGAVYPVLMIILVNSGKTVVESSYWDPEEIE